MLSRILPGSEHEVEEPALANSGTKHTWNKIMVQLVFYKESSQNVLYSRQRMSWNEVNYLTNASAAADEASESVIAVNIAT